MSKRIFFGFSAGIGPFIRCLPIMEELRAAGHRLSYNAIDGVVEKMTALGYDLVSVPWVSGQDETLLPPMTSRWFDAADYWGALGYCDTDWVRRLWSTYAESVVGFRPDVIVGDFGIEARMAARILGVPFLSITQGCYHPRVRGGRLRWWEQRPEAGAASDKALRLEPLNGLLREMSLDPIERFEDFFLGDLTVLPSFEEFDELDGAGEDTRFVGPILWNGDLSSASPRPGPEAAAEDDMPVIFVYTGRLKDFVGDSGATILEACLTYMEDRRVKLVLSVGGMDDLGEYLGGRPLPANMEIRDWVPVEEACLRSSLVIHHGGHGSCMATFLYGTPALVIPTHSEREYNARSLARLGAGKMLLPEQITQARLRTEIDEILGDPRYSETALRWQAELRRRGYGGARTVAGLVEGLAEGVVGRYESAREVASAGSRAGAEELATPA